MPKEIRAREIWWLNVDGTQKTKFHRAVIVRVETDRVLAVWGQSVPGDQDDVIVRLGAPEATSFHVDRDTHFRLENVVFAEPSAFGKKLGDCPFRLFGKFQALVKKRLEETEQPEPAAAPEGDVPTDEGPAKPDKGDA